MPNKNRSRLDDVAEEMPPPIAIGHVTLSVSDVGPAADFYRALGLRPILEREELAILELRGGTHLVLFRAEGEPSGVLSATMPRGGVPEEEWPAELGGGE